MSKILRIEDPLLDGFHQANPQADVLALNLLDQDQVNGLDFGVDRRSDPDTYDQRLSRLMAYQRLGRLGATGAEAKAFIDADLTSAQAVASVSQALFVKRHVLLLKEASGIPQAAAEARLRELHGAARATRSRVQHLWAEYQSRLSPHLRATKATGHTQSYVGAVADIPDYESLFGNQDYCHCEHCKSIFGPAAYLTDLLRVTETYITDDNSGIPTGYKLSQRRQDIYALALTCENTNTVIPTLEIVNGALENLISATNGADYEVATGVSGFLLPENLPLVKIEQAFEALGTSLGQVYASVVDPTGQGASTLPSQADVVRETLKLSVEQARVAQTQANSDAALEQMFGVSALNLQYDMPGTYSAAKDSTTVTASDSSFSTGLGVGAVVFLGGVARLVTSIDASAATFEVDAKFADALSAVTATSIPVGSLVGDAKFSHATGLDFGQLSALFTWDFDEDELAGNLPALTYLNGAASGAWLSIITDKSDPSALIQYLGRSSYDSTGTLTTSAASKDDLDRINRFARMHTWLGWSAKDLGIGLLSATNDLSAAADYDILALIDDLGRGLKLDVSEAAALWSPMNTLGRGKTETAADLYDQIFNRATMLLEGKTYRPVFAGNPLYSDPVDTWTIAASDDANTNRRAWLAGTLGVSFDDLTQLAEIVSADGTTVALSVENLSCFYRVVRLATALGISVGTMMTQLKLMGVTTADWTAKNVTDIVAFHRWLQASTLTLGEYGFLIDVEVQPAYQGPLPADQLLPALEALWEHSIPWRVTRNDLGLDTLSRAGVELVFSLLVSANVIDATGLVTISSTQFQGVSANHIVTATMLESANLITSAQAQTARQRLIDGGVLLSSGALVQPYDLDTDLSYLFDNSNQQASQVAWVGSVLAQVSGAIGFDIISPVLPMTEKDFEVGSITSAQAAGVFADLKSHGVLTATGSLASPFDQATDLSYLFNLLGGDEAQIASVREVLVSRSDVVLQTGSVVLTALNQQEFGVYGFLSERYAQDKVLMRAQAEFTALLAGIPNIVETLLTPIPIGAPIGTDLFAFFDILSRLNLLNTKAGIGERDFGAIVQMPTIVSLPSLSGAPTQTVAEFILFGQLKQSFGAQDGQLSSILGFPQTTPTDLAALTHWSVAQIVQLTAAFYPGNPTGWNDVNALKRMSVVFDLADKTGADISAILSLAALAGQASLPMPVYGDSGTAPPAAWTTYENAAASALHTMQANLGDHAWNKMTVDINDSVNEIRRNCYVQVALASPSVQALGLTSAMAVSEYLLIDIEVAGCGRTSRIASAIASVQMYMLRCRLNLEAGVAEPLIPDAWWEWLEAYRLWEANRKIFLYPENYIDPSLRPSATPLFKKLQDTLSQNELTPDSVTKAFDGYMDGFAEVGSLQIIDSMHALAPDPDTGAPTKTLFVVGRTASQPYQFYVRRLIDSLAWTPWKKVDAQIPASHVVPAYGLNRLMLAWTEVDQTEVNNIGGSGGDVAQTNAMVWKAQSKFVFERFADTWTAPQNIGPSVPFGFDSSYFSNYMAWDMTYIDVDTSQPAWHQPYPITIGDPHDPQAERLIFVSGQYWQSSDLATPAAPGTTLFPTLDAIDQQVYKAGTLGSKVTNIGLLPAVPLTSGYCFDQALRATTSNVAFISNFNAGSDPNYVYGAQYDTSKAAGGSANQGIGLYLTTNAFVGNALSNGDYLTKDPSKSPWHISGPVGNLYNLALGIAKVEPVKNQLGWFIFNNGDEAFLGRAQISDLRLLSDGIQSQSDALGLPTELVLSATAGYTADPDLTTTVVKYDRLTTGAIARVSAVLFGGGVGGMLAPAVQLEPGSASLSFTRFYTPGAAAPTGTCDPHATTPAAPATVDPPANLCGGKIDFGGRGDLAAYGLYWRELYFHAPFLIAAQLNTFQRFREAKTWFEYIFDPTSVDQSITTDDRYWNYTPFRGLTVPSLLDILSDQEAIRFWNNHPFDPHAIADLRPSAYQKSIVVHYIQNLLDWADNLFRRDTREDLSEATMLYFLASELLGPRPVDKGPCSTQPPMSFNDIVAEYGSASDIPQFLIHLEQSLSVPGGNTVATGEHALPFNEINAYFGVPENPDFIKLWDQVEDRLFKLRHCMNIDGQVRALALFAPPIDPGALAASLAHGGGASSALQMLDGGIPNYRFWTMLDRAKGMCSAVQGFGQALQQALEAKDAEAMSVLQNQQSLQILEMTTTSRELAIDEAKEAVETLRIQRQSTVYREGYYQGLIDTGLSPNERLSLVYMTLSAVFSTIAGGIKTGAGFAHLVPNVGSPFAMTYGGKQIGASADAFAALFDTIAGEFSFGSNLASTMAGYHRREEDWQNQLQLAEFEIQQIDSQLKAAELRVQMAERELEILQEQTAQEEENRAFMESKFTNEELYAWLVGRLSTLYFQAYQTAYNVALSAQKALQFELDSSQSYVKYGYWESLRKGLSAGDSLSLALMQMEQAFLQGNTPQITVEKTISLAQLDPVALMTLKQTGTCDFALSAQLFDGDFPGLFSRKIQSLSVSVPAVTGPYDSINGTLTQLSNYIVLTPDPDTELFLLGKSGVATPDSSKLRVNWRANSQILISTGVNDTGAPRSGATAGDDRYTAFEGTGAISTWRLELPQPTNRVDIATIPDVVIKLSYGAYNGGSSMKDPVIQELSSQGYSGSNLIVLGNQYPDAWYGFINPPGHPTSSTMSFATPAAMFPSNLSGLSLTEVHLGLTLAPNVSFTGDLDMTLTIPGEPTPQAISFKNGSLATSVVLATPDSAFQSGNWTLEVKSADIPSQLKSAQTGLLDPAKVLNLGAALLYTATINWTG